MKIVADSKIPFVREAFADVAEVVALDTQAITRDAVCDADALLVRSETTVDNALLHGSSVRFIGTATIGTDHVDTDYLEQQGIGFASAPGSNANSVAEYIVTALLVLSQRLGFALEGRTLGVVGIGNVGSIVVKYGQALGMKVLQNDHPLARATGNPIYRSLDELMDADIITIHVPLTRGGPDKTYHLFDEQRIALMKKGGILINTARGGVVETDAIKKALRSHHLHAGVLDVWEKEPTIDTELLSLVTLGTPHIAGYSYDGKVNGTAIIHKAACNHFGWRSTWTARNALNQGAVAPITIPEGLSIVPGLLAIIKRCYDIEEDDRALRRVVLLADSERGAYFRQLRVGYPVRREFSYHEVTLSESHSPLVGILKTVGFQKITLKA